MQQKLLTNIINGTFSISNAQLALLKVMLGSKYETQMAEWFEHFLRVLSSKKIRVGAPHYSCHNFSKTYQLCGKATLKFKASVYSEKVQHITCTLQGFTGNTKIQVNEFHRLCESQLIEDILLKESSDDSNQT